MTTDIYDFAIVYAYDKTNVVWSIAQDYQKQQWNYIKKFNYMDILDSIYTKYGFTIYFYIQYGIKDKRTFRIDFRLQDYILPIVIYDMPIKIINKIFLKYIDVINFEYCTKLTKDEMKWLEKKLDKKIFLLLNIER